MKQGRIALVFGCLWVLAGCGGGEKADEDLAQLRGSTKGRFFVCVMDVSASMKQNDRGRYAEQGAQLAVALLSEQTNFGAVAFSSGAWVQSDITRISGDEDRSAIQKRLAAVPRQGATNYVEALAVARSLILKKMAAGSTGAVVFLTDGEPTVGGSMSNVEAEVDFYAAMKWPIYTIGLSDKADVQLLQKMAAKTGGAHFGVDQADDLLSAFVDVVSLTEGLFVKRGPFGTVTVMPDTKRLIYLIAKNAKDEASISTVTLKGDVAKSKGVYNYPHSAGKKSIVAMRSYNQPEQGTWKAEAQGTVSEYFILQQPPFDLSLVAQQPRAKYVEGQSVHMAVLARASKKTILAELREHVTIKGEVMAGDPAEVIDDVDLPPEAGEEVPDPLVYHGTTTAKLSKPETGEVLTANLLCELKWGEEEVWTHKKIVSFQVVPATGLFAVQPETLDFGAFWSDSEPAELKMSILSNQEQALFHLTSESKAISFEPRLIEIEEGKEQEVTVRFDPSKAESLGEIEASAVVSLDIGDVSGKQWTEEVKLTANVVKLVGDGVIELPDTTPGYAVQHVLTHTTDPEGPLKVELSELVHTVIGPDEVHTKAGEGDAAPGATTGTTADEEIPDTVVVDETIAGTGAAAAEGTPAGETAEGVAAEGTTAAEGETQPMDAIAAAAAIAAAGMKAEGAGAEGVKAEGVKAEGVKAEGVEADGVAAEGVKAEGVKAEGVKAEGAAGTEPTGDPAAPKEVAEPDVPAGPIDRDAAKLALQLKENDEGVREIGGEVPLGAPSGWYVGKLTVSIPEGSRDPRPSERPAVPAPKVLKVMLAVGDMKPRLEILHDADGETVPLNEISMVATERGWAETRIKFRLKHADVAELAFEKKDLQGPGGATISQRFLIQTLPQNEWDGKTLEHGSEYELLYRVFATSDLVMGEYKGELPVKLIRNGEVARELSIPIKVKVDMQ